ncbi:hypothetical protein O3777_00675 [Gemella sanguinis]|jgi:hypothetical protein|uniref:hypothetical protein n=1 Tax=Gemella sanguinis TaxID=84135 RepID=UPI00352D519F
MLKNIKYKKTHGLITLLEVILIVMISGWYYYSERKMGMIRHIMAKNVYKFPKYFTNTNIKLIVLALSIMILIQLFIVIRSKKHVETFLVNLVLTGIGTYTILACNADSIFIYYYWIIFFGLFNLLRFLQFFTLKMK